MKKVFLLTDYRGQFYSSTKHRGASVDIDKLTAEFLKAGFELVVRPFSGVNLREQNYKNEWVLYQSSEDPGLFFRSYVEDIVFGLLVQGAKLIPSFEYFKAHHNKHFMEILRDLCGISEIKNIEARRYGTFEEYQKDLSNLKERTYILKSSETSKSKGVFLLRTLKDKLKFPERVSRTFSLKNWSYLLEEIKTGKKLLKISNHRKKFILQPFIEDIKGDYRIVVYNDKYYVLYRENRRNDFRASGSMLFNYDVVIPDGLLDYAKKVFSGFNAPFMALDVGVKGNDFFLFEFQFLSFGQYTIEKSSFFYSLENGGWKKVFEKPNLEREIAASVVAFMDRNGNK